MPLTIDEILQCQDRLETEIAERECLLAALKVMKGYAERGKSLNGIELGALGKVLLAPERTSVLALEPASEEPVETPPPAPALPQPKRYIHPDLAESGYRHGSDTATVNWAVERMSGDFTLHDIEKLLRREGAAMRNAQISVVLTRLLRNGRISLVRSGGGPIPSVFRNPNSIDIPHGDSSESVSRNDEAPVSAAA